MENVKNGTNIKTIINFIGTGIKTNTEIRKELCDEDCDCKAEKTQSRVAWDNGFGSSDSDLY